MNGGGSGFRELFIKQYRKITDFLFAIGYFSEIIILLVVIYVLRHNHLDEVFFIVFFFLSGLMNTFLKEWIKEDRPKNVVKYLYSENISYTKKIYGMPSGHSQNVFFSLFYLFLSTHQQIYWLELGVVLTALMFYERWAFHNHTLLQLSMGAVVGVFLAYFVVFLREFVRKEIQGVGGVGGVGGDRTVHPPTHLP